MITKQLTRFALCALGVLAFTSCLDKPFEDLRSEYYARNFIKTFGLIDPEQDWNMAKEAVVKLNVGDRPVQSLKIYGKQDSKYYLIADLDEVSGQLNVPVDVPKDCEDILVKADGRKYYGTIGTLLDLTSASRAGDLNSTDDYNPRKDNTNTGGLLPDSWGKTQGLYSIERKYTRSAKEGTYNEYQYFNTQQMAPIVTPEGEEWADYYSLNQEKMVYNTNHDGGLLPESGIFTRKISDFTDHVNKMRSRGHTMTYDFTVTVEDGTFTFFPYYYGTNFTHDLGIYLLDEDGNPILKNGDTYNSSEQYDPLTHFVCFKIFEDRMTGDLQTQPHYYNETNPDNKEVKSIKVKAKDVATDTWLNNGNFFSAGSTLYLSKGQQIQFYVWAYDEGENELFSNANGDEGTATFFDAYHSRIAYHVWDKKDDNDHSWQPFTFATVTKDGLMEAVSAVDEGYMDITVGAGILYTNDSQSTTLGEYTGVTSVTGPRLNLNVHIEDNSTTPTETDITSISVNPAASTNGDNLRYYTFGEYKNIVFYIPKGQTVTLPVEAFKGTTKVTNASDLNDIEVAEYDDNYTITKSNGVFTVTAANTVTSSELTTESGINGDLPWVNLYIESNGQSGYQHMGNKDEPAFGFKIIVYDPTVTAETPHKHTETVTQSTRPDAVQTIWDNYFNSNGASVNVGGSSDHFSAPAKSRATTEEKVLWSGSQTLEYTNKGDYDELKTYNWLNWGEKESDPHYSWDIDLSQYQSLKFEFDSNNLTGGFQFALKNPTYGYWHGSEWFNVDKATFVFDLDTEIPSATSTNDVKDPNINLRNELTTGIAIQGKEATLLKISLVPKSSGNGGTVDPPVVGNSLVEALETHYASNNLPTTCDEAEHASLTHDFSNSTVKVNILDDAAKDYIHFTVTWTYTSLSTVTVYQGEDCSNYTVPSSAPAKRHNAPSRADVKPALLTDGGESKWVDVNAAWSKYLPKGEEVSSYPPNQPMLGRTRGYDVFINYNGEPFNGKVGMYLTTKKIIKLGDNSGKLELADLDSSLGSSYTLYSQSKYNFSQKGITPSHQPAAISFKHPTSSRTFFAFEDRRLDHNDPPYSYWDDSSDLDLNDMIFLLSNYDAVEGTGDKITEEEDLIDTGFPWIWAVEDLGSTDDFDFNDLVVKIESITKIHHTATTSTGSEGTTTTPTDTYASMYKKVTFTPLCAGGTLPLYINLKVDGKVYVLKPGTYKLGTDLVELSADNSTPIEASDASDLIEGYDENSAEVHKWFGNGTYRYQQMINTGMGYDGVSAKSCVVYVKAPEIDTKTGNITKEGFQINVFSSADGNTKDNYDVIDNASDDDVYFYVSVNRNDTQGNIYDDRSEFTTITPPEFGQAPQSFIIKATYTNKNFTWRWPHERAHILAAYPNFKNWVSNREVTNWTDGAIEMYIYKENK